MPSGAEGTRPQGKVGDRQLLQPLSSEALLIPYVVGTASADLPIAKPEVEGQGCAGRYVPNTIYASAAQVRYDLAYRRKTSPSPLSGSFQLDVSMRPKMLQLFGVAVHCSLDKKVCRITALQQDQVA